MHRIKKKIRPWKLDKCCYEFQKTDIICLKVEIKTFKPFFRFERTEPVLLNVQERPDLLDDLIANHDVVVSLLPWQLHPEVDH